MRKRRTIGLSIRQSGRARALRRNLTDGKRITRYGVRTHRLNGALRRQHANFVGRRARLGVEVDGGQHLQTRQVKLDRRRDAFLAARGYQVLRLRNRDVMTDRRRVVEAIANAVLIASRSPPARASGRAGPSSEPAP